jgi:hypothetical protein
MDKCKPLALGDKPYSLVRRDTSFIYEDFMSTGRAVQVDSINTRVESACGVSA